MRRKPILNFTYILRNFEFVFTRGKKGLEVVKCGSVRKINSGLSSDQNGN